MYTINESITFFINEHEVGGSAASTLDAYSTDLIQFKEFLRNKFAGVRKIEQVRLKHISEYRMHLVKEKQFKKNTVKRKIDLLKAFFNKLKEYEYISENPVPKLIGKNTKEEKLPRYLEYSEIAQIIQAAKEYGGENSKRDVAALCALAYLGARRSEILGLDWSKVNLFERTVIIYREKNKTPDVLPLKKELYCALKELNIESRPNPSDPVFISKKGNRLSNTAFNDMFRKYVKISGIKKEFDITSHVFRHSFCTELSKQGADIIEIRQYTGHKDLNSLKTYTHFTQSKKRATIDKLPAM